MREKELSHEGPQKIVIPRATPEESAFACEHGRFLAKFIPGRGLGMTIIWRTALRILERSIEMPA
jgi:hypothetical protein